MTTITHDRPQHARRWTPLATIWLAGMVSGWLTFFALTLLSPGTIADLWTEIRALPLVVELLLWLAAFPFVLATAVWETSWADWARLALVASFAVAWTLVSIPWKEKKR